MVPKPGRPAADTIGIGKGVVTVRVLKVPEEPSARPPELRGAEEEAPAAAPAPSYPLVLVRWRDAWFDADQQDTKDWRVEYVVHTVGYLIREEKGILSVASEVLPEGDGFRAVTHIPKAIILSITTLGPAEHHRRHPNGRPA